MNEVTEADCKLLADIKGDSKAYNLLKHKCRWEAMGAYAVLNEWGDPRTWPAYAKAEAGCSTRTQPDSPQGQLDALWADSEPIPPVRDQRVSVADRSRLKGLNLRVLELLREGPRTNVELAEALGHASSWRTRASDCRLWLERHTGETIVSEKREGGVWVYRIKRS